MSKQYTYRVTEKRFYDGVLYSPGEREIISTDTPFPKGTKGVELINGAVAEKVKKAQTARMTAKQKQAQEAAVELAKSGNVPPPDFSGTKKSNVVTL